MIATYINAAAVIVGALIGLLLRRAISDRFRDVVTSGIGVITLVLASPRPRVAADRLLGPVGGGRRPARRVVEDREGVTGLGAALHRLLWRRETAAPAAADSRRGFAVAS